MNTKRFELSTMQQNPAYGKYGKGKTSATKGEFMKTCKITVLALTTAFALSFLTTGCERTGSSTETEKVKSDGTVEKKEKTITEQPDGTIKKEEKKTTENP